MKVAIVGGTGAEGFGLALRLARAGHQVTIGSRLAEKAAEAVSRAKEVLGSEATVDGTTNLDSVAGAQVIVVSVPFAAMVGIYESIGPGLSAGQVVLDCTSPLMTAVGGKAFQAISPWQGSAGELAATLVPEGVHVVSGLHTVAAEALSDLDQPLETDTLLCGDDPDAKALVGAMLEDIPGLRWVNAGGLSMARIAETITPLLINVNRRYRLHDAGFRITGRETWGHAQA